MLYRMYHTICTKKNFKIELLDYQAGDEAGIKSVTMMIKGDYAYGYLKAERGVHDLSVFLHLIQMPEDIHLLHL
jgi:peptide chain release factor 2